MEAIALNDVSCLTGMSNHTISQPFYERVLFNWQIYFIQDEVLMQVIALRLNLRFTAHHLFNRSHEYPNH